MKKDALCFEFDKVSFSWPGGRTVLDRQDMALPEGVFAQVRGPSGSGKSTLLRLMNRLEQPISGEIRYMGQCLTEWDPPGLRQQVTYLQQTPFVPDRPVRDILAYPFHLGVNKGKILPSDQSLRSLLDRVQLGALGLDESGAALSGGQRQRLGLLRAVIANPRVLLLDEPTASLDKESRTVVEEMAVDLCRQGITIVMVTHDDFVPQQVPVAEVTMQQGRMTECLALPQQKFHMFFGV